ncbi:MAG: sensor histidine kinase [Candidatus Nanopelagicales bacterium]
MTTYETGSNRRRWWQYFGPWPFYPLAVGSFAALIAVAVRSVIMTVNDVPMELLTAVIFGFIIGAVLALAKRFLPRVVSTLPGYVVTMIVAVTVATLVRSVQGYVPDYPGLTPRGDVIFAIFRVCVGLFAFQIIIGTLMERLQGQVDATQEALDIVEAQAEALLRADEEVRRSVATMLHDRVQGGLLAACLRLQAIAPDTASSREEIDRVIHELEQLRAIDVRRAVRTLSPSLQDIDLESAVIELVEPYLSAVAVSITIPRDAVQDPHLRLAAYRIIEQGVLNAVEHGEATHIAIGIECPPGQIDITIADDGRGLPTTRTSGFGTMLVDTWCRSLGGSWTLKPGRGSGAVLSAHLPT